jgi:hypothetical protein
MKLRTFLLAALVATLTLAACGPADDEAVDAGNDPGDDLPLGAGPYPVGTLEITVTHPDRDPLGYTISCLGDTATITPAVDGLVDSLACEQLTDPAVQTLLVEGPPQDRICTEIYGGPDEARIVGTLDDQVIDTVITRNNGCGISDWDDMLSEILPPAVGAID